MSANFQYLVQHYVIIADRFVNVIWKCGNGTQHSGVMPLAPGVPVCPATCPFGQFVTDPGHQLVLNLSKDAQVGGHIQYLLLG